MVLVHPGDLPFFHKQYQIFLVCDARIDNINELTEKNTEIEFALGKLSISIDEKNSIHMKGPVSDIQNIEIKL